MLLRVETTTAVIALGLYVAYAALAFGWRSWVQWRRTGSTGFRGFSGRPWSVEWLAGVGFVVAIGVGVVAPVLQLLGIVSPLSFVDIWWIQVLGLVLAVAGIVGTLYAQLDMGASWRIGVDAGETTELVRGGTFVWARNPIFTAMLVFALGEALLAPNLVAIAGFAVLLATIELQVRVVEEPYLLDVHGDDYRRYTASVGRFIPGIGLVR